MIELFVLEKRLCVCAPVTDGGGSRTSNED